jgi:hypothetical protein
MALPVLRYLTEIRFIITYAKGEELTILNVHRSDIFNIWIYLSSSERKLCSQGRLNNKCQTNSC